MDLEQLIGQMEAAVAVDPRSLLDDSLCDRELQLDRLRNLVGVAEALTLGELEERRTTDLAVGMHTAQWLTHAAKVAPAAARRKVKTASKLRHLLPEVHAAWTAGLVNEHHVRVFHDAANPRIRHEIAARQAELIALAGRCSFDHWRQIMANLVAILDQDGAFDPDAELERNRAHFSATMASCSLTARFDRVAYATIKHLVEAKADELHRHDAARSRSTNGELPIPTRPTLRALAIHELIIAGAAAASPGSTVTDATVVLTPDLAATAGVAPDPACTDAGCGDGLGDEGDPWLDLAHRLGFDDVALPDDRDPADGSDRTDPFAPAPGDDRHDDFDPRRRHGSPGVPEHGHDDHGHGGHAHGSPGAPPPGIAGVGWRAWTLDGLLLPGASPELGAKLCSAAVNALIADPDGLPLRMGRSARLFRDHQRRAIDIRDGGCVMPGCTAPPSGCRYHHFQEWDRDRGPTDVENGAGLCPRDHGVGHREGWATFITADGWPWFRPPSGRSFWGQRHGHQRTGPTPDQPGYVEGYDRDAQPDALRNLIPSGRPPPARGAPPDPIVVLPPSQRQPPARGAPSRSRPGSHTEPGSEPDPDVLDHIRSRLRDELLADLAR